MRTRNLVTAIAAVALMNAAGASAQTALPTTIQVSQPGDAAMDCPALTAEIAQMDQIIGQAQQNQGNAQTNGQVAGAVGAAATSAALYSGALGSVPGLGFLARGAENAARARAEQQAKQNEKLAADATQRRTMLMGIHTGRNCAAQQQQNAAAPVEAAPASYAPAGATTPAQ
jgi:hypothetical protein